MDDKSNTTKKTKQPAVPETPAPTPAQPVQPAAAAPQAPPAAPAKKSGLSKKAIWGIVGGVVGLVVIIVGVVLAVVLLAGPGKEDYQEALQTVKEIDASEISSKLRNTEDSDYQQKVDEAIKQIDDTHNKVNSLKAMRDQDVKSAYDKYIDKWNKIKPDLQNSARLIKPFRTYQEDCRAARRINFSTIVNSDDPGKKFDETMADCLSATEALSKLDDKASAQYGKDMVEYYSQLKEYVFSLANRYKQREMTGPRPSYPTMPDTKNPMLEVASKLREGANDLDSDFKAFTSVLNDKIKQAS